MADNYKQRQQPLRSKNPGGVFSKPDLQSSKQKSRSQGATSKTLKNQEHQGGNYLVPRIYDNQSAAGTNSMNGYRFSNPDSNVSFGNPQYPNKNPNPEFQHTFAQEKPIFDNENLIKYWEPQIMGRPTKQDFLAAESHQEMLNNTQNSNKQMRAKSSQDLKTVFKANTNNCVLQKQMASSKVSNNRRANAGIHSNTIDSTKSIVNPSQQDETWKKLEDLINIGRTEQRVSLKSPAPQVQNLDYVSRGSTSIVERSPRFQSQIDFQHQNGPAPPMELRTSSNSVYQNQFQTIVPQSQINLRKFKEDRNNTILQEAYRTPTTNLLNQTPAWVNNPRTNSNQHYAGDFIQKQHEQLLVAPQHIQFDLDQLRLQIKDIVAMQRDQQHQVYNKLDTLESQKQSLEVQVTQVRNEQRKILGSFVDLENRYKDIIHENKIIKSELADLRKNNHQNSKVIIADQINLPLRRDERATYTPGRTSLSNEDYNQQQQSIYKRQSNQNTKSGNSKFIKGVVAHQYSQGQTSINESQSMWQRPSIKNSESHHSSSLNTSQLQDYPQTTKSGVLRSTHSQLTSYQQYPQSNQQHLNYMQYR